MDQQNTWFESMGILQCNWGLMTFCALGHILVPNKVPNKLSFGVEFRFDMCQADLILYLYMLHVFQVW